MVNGSINGLASLRTYYLESWYFQGAMFLYLALKSSKDYETLEFLNNTLNTPASLDMLVLTERAIAGYNPIGRTNTQADFTLKMKKQSG